MTVEAQNQIPSPEAGYGIHTSHLSLGRSLIGEAKKRVFSTMGLKTLHCCFSSREVSQVIDEESLFVDQDDV
jgi:hypothetical protein